MTASMTAHPLDVRAIRKVIPSKVLSSIEKIECFDIISSTNQYLLDAAREHHPQKTWVCIADQQIIGRGRQARTWFSPPNVNIYFSLLCSLKTAELSGLSIVIGIIIAEALQQYGIKNISLKWPNDILCDHQKLGGILVETFPNTSADETFVVIGIGLNVNMIDPPLELITQPWTSLAQINHRSYDRNKIIGLLIERCLVGLVQLKQNGLTSFTSLWHRYDELKNKMIFVEMGGQIIAGTAEGITPEGYLLLRTGLNQLQTIISADKIQFAWGNFVRHLNDSEFEQQIAKKLEKKKSIKYARSKMLKELKNTKEKSPIQDIAHY